MAIVKVVMHLKWITLNAYAFRIFLIINKCNKSNLDFELASEINGILINDLFFSVARA